jgi:hypothetical protein
MEKTRSIINRQDKASSNAVRSTSQKYCGFNFDNIKLPEFIRLSVISNKDNENE